LSDNGSIIPAGKGGKCRKQGVKGAVIHRLARWNTGQELVRRRCRIGITRATASFSTEKTGRKVEMSRIGPAGFTGETQDGDFFAADAWTAAFESADIAADYAGAFEIAEIDPLDIEDDLFTLVAERPSRRLKVRH
jgi:hypothetical protein